MAENSHRELQMVRELPNYRRPELAPIEHKMLGSSSDIKGFPIGLKDLIDRFREGDKMVADSLLVPTGIQGEGIGVKPLVVANRLDQNLTKNIIGIPIIDCDLVAELAKKNKVDVWLELSRIDEFTNHVGREWKIFLVRGKEVIKDQELLRKLKLHNSKDDPLSPDKIFSLEFPENVNYAILKLNLGKGQSA